MTNNNGYIAVNGTRIYYEISGNLNGEPLLMLHGGLGSINELRPIHKYLVNHFQLISVDFRGHGESFLGHLPLSYRQYQEDVQILLGYLGITRYSIFGFSDGGVVGYRLAIQEPNRVTCLITLGAQWQVNTEEPSMALLASLTANYWCKRFPDDVALYQCSNPEPDFPKLVNAVKKVWFDKTESGYPCHLVAQISCPTLIIRGDNDFIFSLGEASVLKTKIAGCSFANIPFTTHAAHQELPDIVGMMIQRFMILHNK